MLLPPRLAGGRPVLVALLLDQVDGRTLSDREDHTYTSHHHRLDGRFTGPRPTGIGRDSRHDVYPGRRAYVWNSTSDTAMLRNDYHRFVDSVSWGGHRHHRPTNRPRPGERCPPAREMNAGDASALEGWRAAGELDR
ncbi:hypothetical protein ACFY2M_44445 [Streptomyces sp. NPDC001276]|uniref:hypothetical protein n=1 Tax=Streptomyces sp. NPDC001276 TaxID=3364555 RepID=UPI0036A879AC